MTSRSALQRVEPMRARRRLVLATMLIALLVCLSANAADPFDSATLNVRSYFDTDGLPQNSVESMSLDGEGRLWVATRDGGASFDGTAWTTIPMPDPLGTNWPRDVLAASDGSVWFTVEPEAINRWTDGVWKTWSGESGFHGSPRALIEHSGSLFVATSTGIFALDLKSPSPVQELDGFDVVALAATSDRIFAVASDGTVFIRGKRTWAPDPQRRVSGAQPTALFASAERLLVGTSNGIIAFEGGTEATAKSWASPAPVSAIVETRLQNGTSTLWAATEGSGLLTLQDDEWVSVEPRIRVPNRYVYDLLVAPGIGPAAHLVVGSLSGIGRIDLASWRHVGVEEGLPDASVVSMLESHTATPGTWYLGTTSGAARFAESGRWEPAQCQHLRSVGVFSMLESERRGRIFFGTGSGVVALDANDCERMSSPNRSSVVALAETGTESTTLWAGTYGEGLWKLDDSGRWIPAEVDLPDARIEAFAVSGPERKTLWIATNQGLARISEGTVRLFGKTDGLPHDLVRSLLVRDNEIWVGTARGLARGKTDESDPEWKVVDIQGDGRMENDTVYRIEAGEDERIYAFTGRGVARLEHDAVRDTYSVGRVFLSDDGLPSSETNFGASLVDSKGRIWAGTPLGAGIFDPALEVDAPTATHRLSVSLVLEPEGIPVHNGDVLDADIDRVVASFRLIDLVHGHRAIYRTELRGLDTGPGLWTPTAQRIFSRLPGGLFELRVWARDPHGHEAGPVVISFSVQQPAWLSWWAVLIYVAAAVILLYTAVGLRIRTLRHRNRELELIVRSRTRDLEVANRQLESANATLADMSVTDPLTGARNRRFLLQKLEQEAVRVRRSTRESDDIVFLLVDIDRFKFINDRFGHATGDHVLKQFHRILMNAVRDTDTIVRWGGEEFLIVARRISRDESTLLAQRILDMVRGTHFESTDASRHLRMTCSIGFASFPFVTWDRSLFTWEQVVDIADHCLYAAKRSGRDAWVSLAAGPRLRADSFLSRMRDDVPGLAATEEVVVATSIVDATTLDWR